ncbi:MAG: hypothetical protein FWE91_12760 [Defluviitaleaceae bacterium]|nr:hypothetical protein [Defluviitaleaceae bacterium]MCL2836929.1 hypothetical protein [Defluviitaleaceae bacterium]
MGDVFKEQLVKRMPTRKDALIKFGIISGCLLIAVIALALIPGFLPIIVGVMGFVLFYVFGMMKKEFEYIITNGELDIDCIYGKARRRRKFSCDVRQALILAHAGNRDAEHELKAAEVVMDLGSGAVNENTWHLLAAQGGKRIKVIFEPNEMMFNAIKSYISPRKIYKKL